jgi:hypothetical protein
MYVTCKRGVVGEDAMIADQTIVRDVGVGHQKIIIADGGFETILYGTAMNGDAFANHIVIADHQASVLALVF